MAFIGLSGVWGASFLWIKIAVRDVSPGTVVVLRVAFALAALAPFAWRQRPARPDGPRAWADVVVQAIVSASLPWLLIAWAETRIDSALATVLNATVPMFTLLIAHATLPDDRFTARRAVGLALGFAGVALLVWPGAGGSIPAARSPAGVGVDSLATAVRALGVFAGGAAAHATGGWRALAGEAAMLAAALAYAASNVFGRARFRGRPAIYQAFYTLAAAEALALLAAPWLDLEWPDRAITWVALAWLGVLSAGLSYLVFYWLLHQVGPTRVSTVTYTIPVVGVTLGVTVLGEALTGSLVAGSLLVISGVRLVSRHT